MLTLNMTVLSTSAIGSLSFEGSKLMMSHCRSAELNDDDNVAFISIFTITAEILARSLANF